MRLIAATLIAASLFSTVAVADDFRPIRTITVQGKAERSVVPDEAHVSVSVSALDTKLKTAKAEHDQKLRKVFAVAESAGIELAQIKTQSSNVQPEYSYANNTRSFKGYRVATSLDMTVSKIDSVGGLLEKLLAAGLEDKENSGWMGLVSVNYTIANPDRLRDEMVVEAIRNAHDKAARMAASAGASLGKVHQINEGNAPAFDYPRPMLMRAMSASAPAMEAAPVAPPPGEQEVNASVTVTYELD